MKIFVLVLCIVLLLANKIRYGTLLTLPSLMTVIWCFSLYFSLFGLYNTIVPDKEVIIYTTIFIVSINFFSFFFSLFYKDKKNSKEKIDASKTKNEKVDINNQKLSLVLIVCTILLIIICNKGILIFFNTKSFDVVRNAFINYESIGVHEQVLLTTTIAPFGLAASMLAVVNYVYNKKMKSSLIYSLVFILIYIFLTGGREYILSIVMTFIIALYLKNSGVIIKIFRDNKKVIRISIVLIIIILFITSQRNLNGHDSLTSFYVYFSGCFNLFMVYLKNGLVFGYKPLYGQSLISGFSFVFIEIVRFFTNTNILPGNYYLEIEATSKYIPISDSIVMNATPTTMYFALRDFGVYGLVIYPLVISYFYNLLKKKYLKFKNILTITLFIHFVRTALFLSMSYRFGSFKNISIFLYIFIIYKICRTKKIEE